MKRLIVILVAGVLLVMNLSSGHIFARSENQGDYYLPMGSLRIDMDNLHGWKSRQSMQRDILGCKVLASKFFNADRHTATVELYLLDNSNNKPLDVFVSQGDANDKKYNIVPKKQSINVNGLNGMKSVYDYKRHKKSSHIEKIEAAIQSGNQVLLFRAKVSSRFDASKRYIFDELIDSIKVKE